MPGLDEFLAGLKPELNDSYEVLTGVYEVVIKDEEKAETGFLVRTWEDGRESRRFQITADVVTVLKGNGQPGRRLWMRYNEDEAGIQKLANDLHTAGLWNTLDHSSVEQLKVSLPSLAGKTLYVRAWGWTPEKDRQGNVLPEGERKTLQQASVKSAKSLTKLLAEADKQPF